jgi:signal transduction histidine kinase
MEKLTDQELLDALRERLDDNRRALNDLRAVTLKLEATNRRLQESEALKSHFLSNIRNEINNPLTAIMGLAAQLMAGGAIEGRSERIGRLIHAEAFCLDFQLGNIFAAAELEAGEAAPAPCRTDVVAILDEVLGQLAHWSAGKGLTVRRDVAGSLPFVTDAPMLQRMLLNLLANAVEFSPEGGLIEVEMEVTAGELRTVIRDRGPGIAPADQAAVFDRFRQLDGGSTKSHRGHGLGLSITRSLAELQGGCVTLVSAPGEGSVFTLLLPQAPGEAAALAPEGNLFLFDHAERF